MCNYLEILSQYINNDENLIKTHRLQGLYGTDIDNIKQKYSKINSMGQIALSKLSKADIKFIVLKGFAVMNIFYDSYWNRIYNDIDILINANDITKAEEVLEGIGYIQGKFDEQNKMIVKSSRKEILYQRLYTHQVHEFLKYDEYVSEIDVNFKFEWVGYKNKKNIISNQLAFNNTMPFYYNGEKFLSLNYEFLFIHLCCHIYNEAVNFVFSYFNKNKDLEEIKLFRIIDIIKLVESNKINWSKVLRLVGRSDIMTEISYTLSIIDLLFPNFIVKYIPNELVIDNDIIDYYFDVNGKMQKWPISLFDRLFNLELKRRVVKSIF